MKRWEVTLKGGTHFYVNTDYMGMREDGALTFGNVMKEDKTHFSNMAYVYKDSWVSVKEAEGVSTDKD